MLNIANKPHQLFTPPGTQGAIAMYLQHTNGKRAVAFSVTVEHAQMVAEQFNKAGIQAEFVTGGTNQAERLKIIDRFNSGRTLVLCGSQVLHQMKIQAEAVIILNPTRSKAVFADQLRTASKPPAVVIDLADNTLRHGLPMGFAGSIITPVRPANGYY